jgi:pyroglutamyl-peptidase
MNVLITGFDPFGGESVNPALEAIKKLDGCMVAGAKVHTCEIPTIRWKSIMAIRRAIQELDPVLVIAVGQAGGRMEITVERVGINVDDFRIKDNEGNQPIDERIVPDGPAAYWSTLPIKKIVSAVRSAGIPCSLSNTAGTFVCNHVFYGLMHELYKEGNKRRGGFIHIPYLPQQAAGLVGQPSMSLELVIRGMKKAIETALLQTRDEKITEGKIC